MFGPNKVKCASPCQMWGVDLPPWVGVRRPPTIVYMVNKIIVIFTSLSTSVTELKQVSTFRFAIDKKIDKRQKSEELRQQSCTDGKKAVVN